MANAPEYDSNLTLHTDFYILFVNSKEKAIKYREKLHRYLKNHLQPWKERSQKQKSEEETATKSKANLKSGCFLHLPHLA